MELQAVQVLLVPLVPPQELLELLQLVLELLVVLPLQYELVLYDLRPLQGSCVLRLQLLCTQAFLLLPLLLLPCSCSCSLTGLSELPPPSLKVLLLVDEVEVGQLLPLLVPVQLLHLLLLVDEHHKEEEDQVDVVQVDEEDLLLNFLVLVVKENLLLLLVDERHKEDVVQLDEDLDSNLLVLCLHPQDLLLYLLAQLEVDLLLYLLALRLDEDLLVAARLLL